MKLQLPAPGVLAAITLLFFVAAVAFSIWWPYHREQAVLESLGTRLASSMSNTSFMVRRCLSRSRTVSG